MKIDRKIWRVAALAHQGLLENPHSCAHRTLTTLGYVQIDTLYVVERAHHHALWNRVRDYHPSALDGLIEDRKAFEHWHHALSYLPMEDYRYAVPYMQHIKSGKSPYYKNPDKKLMRTILDRIKFDGPLRLRDLIDEGPASPKGVWHSRPAKQALQTLFLQGDIMVKGRNKMERIYDLRENILPSHIATNCPTPKEYANYLIETTLRANGFASLPYILHGKSTAALKAQTQELLDRKIAAGDIDCYETDFMPPVYGLKNIAQQSLPAQKRVKILSPFDHAIINRDRAEQLFDFSYRLECYTPAAKRKFGYFCLPILYGTDIIGRLDCKAVRKDGVLCILSLHIEKDIADVDQFCAAFGEEITSFAKFNGCARIDLQQTKPAKYKRLLKAQLR